MSPSDGRGVDLAKFRYVKRIALGGKALNTVTEKDREDQIELLNKCLSGVPPGKIIALEMSASVLQGGDHGELRISVPMLAYHVGFERKPGAAAPQVKRAAANRLADLVDPAIRALREAVASKKTDQVPWATRVAAARDVLDRAGLKNTDNVNLTMLGAVTALDPERLAAMSDEEIDDGIRNFQKMLGRGEGDG